MDRRGFLITLAAGVAAASPAVAQDVVDQVVRQLRSFGYTDITVSRTLLGRVRILASGPKGTREIILNPSTGEILRDLTTRAEGGSGAPILKDSGRDDDDDDDDDNSGGGGGGGGGGGSGGGGGGGGSDDDDDDDDD